MISFDFIILERTWLMQMSLRLFRLSPKSLALHSFQFVLDTNSNSTACRSMEPIT